MRLNNILIPILLLVLISCTSTSEEEFDNSYYQQNREWSNYLIKKDYEKSLEEKVFLIMQTSECSPCLKELTWWNQNSDKFSEIDVVLLLIEKYSATVNVFKKRFDLGLTVLVENDGEHLFNKKLIPATPVKLYFNKQGDISAIDYMGAEGDLKKFVEHISPD